MIYVERVDQAERQPQQSPVRSEQDRGELLNMAVQHHQDGRLDEADSLYRLLLEVDPKLPDALHLFGLICLTRNQPGDAIELIERALAVNPENAAYHGNLGRAYAAFDDFDKALQAFRRAVEINPGSAESLASMGQLLRQMDRTDEAIECLEQAREIQPGSADIESTLGSAYHAAFQLDDAVACYFRAIEIDPDHAAAHANLGLSLFEQSELEGARQHNHRAVAL